MKFSRLPAVACLALPPLVATLCSSGGCVSVGLHLQYHARTRRLHFHRVQTPIGVHLGKESGKASEDLKAPSGASECAGSQRDPRPFCRMQPARENLSPLSAHPEQQGGLCWCGAAPAPLWFLNRKHQRPPNLRLPAPSPGRARQWELEGAEGAARHPGWQRRGSPASSLVRD